MTTSSLASTASIRRPPRGGTTGGGLGGAVATALADGVIAAAVAFLFTLPLVGLRTEIAIGGLAINTRFVEVAVAVALVFLGRFGLSLSAAGYPVPVLAAALAVAGASLAIDFPTAPLQLIAVAGGLIVAMIAGWTAYTGRSTLSRAERQKRMDAIGAKVQVWTIWLAPIAITFAVLLPFLPFADRRFLDIAILILTYIMLGWGLNIIVGLAGLLDLGFVAFYAVGAYSYALMAYHFDLSFWACLPLAGLFAALAGLLLGFPVLRLRGDYFAIVTLGFGEIIRVILLNWYQFTGGPDGIAGIPRPSFFGLAEFIRRPRGDDVAFHQMFGLDYSSLHRMIFLYYLILALALIVNFFTVRIRRLPIGRAWEALREDDIACASLGINRTNIKLAAFSISAMWGGFAGAFFATRQGFISPESFTFIESAIILSVVVLGGMGSQLGVVVAAFVVIGLPEWFRELEQYRMLAFGAGMVLIMLWRPRGLLSHREPTITLARRRFGRAAAATSGEAT